MLASYSRSTNTNHPGLPETFPVLGPKSLHLRNPSVPGKLGQLMPPRYQKKRGGDFQLCTGENENWE